MFLSWGSELNSLSICPDFLSSDRSNWNTFLTSSQGNPTHGQVSRQGRRPPPSVASHHHLGAGYMLLSFSPSSFHSVLYTSEETKENEQTKIQHNNEFIWYKFNHPSCSYDHPFTGLSNAISITAVPPFPGAGNNWELLVARFAGVKPGEEYLSASHWTYSSSPGALTNTHQENT